MSQEQLGRLDKQHAARNLPIVSYAEIKWEERTSPVIAGFEEREALERKAYPWRFEGRPREEPPDISYYRIINLDQLRKRDLSENHLMHFEDRCHGLEMYELETEGRIFDEYRWWIRGMMKLEDRNWPPWERGRSKWLRSLGKDAAIDQRSLRMKGIVQGERERRTS